MTVSIKQTVEAKVKTVTLPQRARGAEMRAVRKLYNWNLLLEGTNFKWIAEGAVKGSRELSILRRQTAVIRSGICSYSEKAY